MKKIYKFLFLLLFGLFIFIPKDTFAQTYKGVHYYYGSDPVFSNYLNTNGTTELLNLTFSNNLNFNANVNTNYLLNIPTSISFSYSTVTTYGETYAINDLINYSSFQFYIVADNNNTWIPGTFENGVLQFVVPGGKTYHKLYARYTSGYAIPQDSAPIYSIALNSGITYYELDGNQNIISGIQEQTEATKEQTESIKEQTESIKEQTEATEKQTEAITSEEAPKLDALEDSAGWLPPGPVDSILNLPLTFFNNLVSNLSKTCQPVNVPLPYVNKNLTLPCISTLYNQLGATTFLNWVGVIVGTIILYNYFLNLYKWIDDTIQMKDNSVDDWGGV